jgi:hypothetical protein
MECNLMTTDLVGLAESTIDAAIRSFRPGDDSSYDHWDSELQHVESLLGESLPTPESQHVFARVRAYRISMTFEVGRYELVLELSGHFIYDVPVDHPSYFTVADLRACCLHMAGAHDEEVRELLDLIRRPEIQNRDYIAYVEHLAKMHPGSVPQDKELVKKMRNAIAELRTLGYDTLPAPAESEETGLEQLAMETLNELRRVNRKKGEALLAETS